MPINVQADGAYCANEEEVALFTGLKEKNIKAFETKSGILRPGP